MYKLRNYQIETIDIINKMNIGDKSLIVLPTGTGKTVCFATVAAKARGKVLIVVPVNRIKNTSYREVNKTGCYFRCRLSSSKY